MNKVYERMAELMYEALTPEEIKKARAQEFDRKATQYASGVKQPKPGTAASARADMERSKRLKEVIADREERRRKALEK